MAKSKDDSLTGTISDPNHPQYRIVSEFIDLLKELAALNNPDRKYVQYNLLEDQKMHIKAKTLLGQIIPQDIGFSVRVQDDALLVFQKSKTKRKDGGFQAASPMFITLANYRDPPPPHEQRVKTHDSIKTIERIGKEILLPHLLTDLLIKIADLNDPNYNLSGNKELHDNIRNLLGLVIPRNIEFEVSVKENLLSICQVAKSKKDDIPFQKTSTTPIDLAVYHSKTSCAPTFQDKEAMTQRSISSIIHSGKELTSRISTDTPKEIKDPASSSFTLPPSFQLKKSFMLAPVEPQLVL